MTKTLTHLVRAGAAAVALSTFATGANAALVPSPNGDPFPEGSVVILDPGTPFNTPFGWVRQIVLSGFEASPSAQFNTPAANDIRYNYASPIFTNDFWTDATGGSTKGYFEGDVVFSGPQGFVVDVFNRGTSTALNLGELQAQIIRATFNGDVWTDNTMTTSIGTMTTQVSGTAPTEGTATFSQIGGQLYVETSFVVQGQFEGRDPNDNCLNLSGNIISCPAFADVELDGDSNPSQPSAVPLPATLALLLPGLLGMAGLRRRKAVAA
jgi:hypothetical protein